MCCNQETGRDTDIETSSKLWSARYQALTKHFVPRRVEVTLTRNTAGSHHTYIHRERTHHRPFMRVRDAAAVDAQQDVLQNAGQFCGLSSDGATTLQPSHLTADQALPAIALHTHAPARRLCLLAAQRHTFGSLSSHPPPNFLLDSACVCTTTIPVCCSAFRRREPSSPSPLRGNRVRRPCLHRQPPPRGPRQQWPPCPSHHHGCVHTASLSRVRLTHKQHDLHGPRETPLRGHWPNESCRGRGRFTAAPVEGCDSFKPPS